MLVHDKILQCRRIGSRIQGCHDELTDALCKTHGIDCSHGSAMRRVVHHAWHVGFVKRIM